MPDPKTPVPGPPQSLWRRFRASSFSKNFRDSARKIRYGRKGRRFVDYYQSRKLRTNESALKHGLMISVGLVLMLIGLILWPVPIVPGFLVGIPGFVIICSRSKLAARLFDALERFFHRLRRSIFGRSRNPKKRRPAGKTVDS